MSTTSLQGEVVCGIGLRSCSNCELSRVANDVACVPEVRVDAHQGQTSTQQRQLNVVAVNAEFARSCIEQEFALVNGQNVSDPTDDGFILGTELLNITFLDSTLENDEAIVVSL